MSDFIAGEIIKSMREGSLPEATQDGFWMGLQTAVRHPEWAKVIMASYDEEVAKDPRSQALLQFTNMMADGLVRSHPVDPS